MFPNDNLTQKQRDAIGTVAMDIHAMSQQMGWHADLLRMAAPHYTGSLNLCGLLEVITDMAQHLKASGEQLEDMATFTPAQSVNLARAEFRMA